MNESSSKYFSREEVLDMGFASVGDNVLIARSAKIYDAKYTSIGSRVTIDEFCVVSGAIEFHNNVHLAHSSLVIGGREGVLFKDFSGLAFGACIFCQSDDYSGLSLTNPTVPMEYRGITRGRVTLGRHVIIGTRSVVFPGVTLADGCAVGAMSVVTKSTDEWSIYIGNPAKRVKARSQALLEKEALYLASLS